MKRLLLCLSLLVFSSTAGAATITFNGAVTNQIIDGFGANINHRSWNNDELKPVLDALVDQAGMTLFRVIYDKTDWESTNDNSNPNVMNWDYYNQIYSSTEFQRMWDLTAYLNQKGISNGLFFNFQGNGPAWMGGGSLTRGLEAEWAEMVASLLIYARQTNHLQFSLVAPDNEMDQVVQGVDMTVTQYTNALHKLSDLLDANGLGDVGFIGPDLANGGTTFMPQMMADPVVMSKLAHFGVHSYSSGGAGSSGVASYLKSSPYPSRNFWMDETGVWCQPCDSGVSGTNSWAYSIATIQYLFAHLANGAAACLVWEGYDSQYNYYNPGQWDYWGLFAVDDINAAAKTYTPRKLFYTLSQLTKWVRPGAQRIGVSGASSPFATLLAFLHPLSGQVTMVGINSAANPAIMSGSLSALPSVQSLALYYTSAATNLAYAGAVPVSNGTFSATVPGNCVFTLVGVPSSLAQIDIAPASPAILAGASQQFSATGTYSDGSTQDITRQAAWSSSASSVAAVNAGGLALGISAGTATITAAVGSITDSTVLTVQTGPLSISTTSLPNTAANVAYSASLAAVGGTPPFNWSILSGSLPPGLTLNSGSGAISGIATATGTFTFTAQVADSGTPAQTATNSFSITVPSTVTLWPGTTVPGVVDEGPDSSVELGVKFRSDVAGNITALRFYKSAANTGTHVGNLWSSAGAKLATATFSNETASGWQQVNLAAPVAISANTVYVASYHANNGHFSEDDNYFLSKGVDNPPLHALTNGVSGGNGVYVYGASSAFPNQTWSSANYWVDVVLRNGPVPVLNSIAVTPANPIIFTGVSQQFTATGSYSDGSAQNITSQAAWVSSNTAVASVKAGGAASAVSAGTTTITASLAGVTGSSLLTVQALPLAITSTSFPTGVVNTAYSTTLTATGGTAPYTWSIAGGALPAGLTLNIANGVISGTPANAGAVSFTAGVTDAGNPVQTATAALAITVASPPPSVVTLWPSTTVPAGVDGGPDSPVELGVKFRSDVPGNLAGIRFYKAAANTGTHVGNLWSSTGTLLASAPFSNETASGWQQVSFGSSVGIASNTVYVASYHANNGHYSADTNYFLSKGVNSPPLHALTNGVSGGNGVYAYGTKSAFPTLTWISANYWVDVAFQPAAAPLAASMAVALSNPTNTLGTSSQLTAQATDAGALAQTASGARGITNAAMSSTPILVITNAANPFSGYYAEVLSAQGKNEFALANLATLSSATLAPHNVVILPQAALTADQVTLLSDWVNAGGNLIAMRPDKQLTGLLGLNNTGTTLSDGCLRVDTSAGPGVGIAGETMRFYGTADLYNLASASSLAAFYSDAQTPTSFPAVTLQHVGPNGGKAAAFTYDLARSIAFTPDLDNVAIHQANEQQRFLVNMVNSMKADKKLLPR